MDKTNILIIILVIALLILINLYLPNNPVNKLISSTKIKLFKKHKGI